MYVISRKPFNDAAKLYPNAREALVHVYTTLRNGDSSAPEELRKVFPSLDNLKYRGDRHRRQQPAHDRTH